MILSEWQVIWKYVGYKNHQIFYKEVIPNPVVVVLKETGNFPLLETPKEVFETYFSFIQKTVKIN